jgi:hypothetical protein
MVLVVAIPYVFASALEQGIHRHRPGAYDVTAPRIAEGEPIPRTRFDAVVTSLPVPDVDADVVIELPANLHDTALVTVGGVTAPVRISPDHPIDEIVALLDRYTAPSRDREAGTHDAAGARRAPHLD